MTSRTRTRANNAQKRKVAAKQQGLSPRGWLIVIGVVVAVGAVLFAAFGLDADADRPTVGDLAGSPTIEGAPLPTFTDPASDDVAGQPAPVVTGTDFDGAPTTIGAPGSPQILLFMASWCPSCQQELPQVVSWLDAGRLPDGVELTAVLTGLDDSRPNWPPDRWIEREGYTGPVLIDDAAGAAGAAYGLSGTPYWVFVDANGAVVRRHAGMLPMESVDATAQQLAAAAG